MPIKRITPNAAIKEYMENRILLMKQAILNNLAYVGEKALEQARKRHRYTDRTGNLTSSIGYCVLDNGKVVFGSDFKVELNGKQGSEEGRKYLNRLISENSQGLVFIMVAGMPYAHYVNEMNLDVLDSAETLAKRMIPEIMKRLKLK